MSSSGWTQGLKVIVADDNLHELESWTSFSIALAFDDFSRRVFGV